MKTKAKKNLLNVIMVALIVIIALCALMAVGNIKGWFGENSESEMLSKEITGIANMERKGVAYTLDKGTPIKASDLIETKAGSEATFEISGKTQLSMGENSEISVEACSDDSTTLKINQGELFVENGSAPKNLEILIGKRSLHAKNSVYDINVQKGSAQICIFKGEVEFVTDKDKKITVKEGNKLVVTDGAKKEYQKVEMLASDLSEYQINKALGVKTGELCFTADSLEKVIEDREKEAREAENNLEEIIVASQENEGNDDAKKEDISVCTVQIQCSSILNNMDKLTKGKNKFVPANGVILATSQVEFVKGETAYDVTKRACSAAGIQIEAAYTPAYGSYYVEGINHLYEFDCGDMSGWMYKVNGWAPNYGCSEYTLKDGDNIVWYYTCNGR